MDKKKQQIIENNGNDGEIRKDPDAVKRDRIRAGDLQRKAETINYHIWIGGGIRSLLLDKFGKERADYEISIKL